jgi:hypothetical protein
MTTKTPMQRMKDVANDLRIYSWSPLEYVHTYEGGDAAPVQTISISYGYYVPFGLADIRRWGLRPAYLADVFEELLRQRKERAREIAMLVLGDAVVFELLDSTKQPFALMTERLRTLAGKTAIEGVVYELGGRRVTTGFSANMLTHLDEWVDGVLMGAYLKHAIAGTIAEYADGE